MGKKIIAGIIIMVMMCSVLPFMGKEIQAADDFQATLSEGLLKWDIYSGANQYEVIICDAEKEPVASQKDYAYAFESEGRCSFDVLAKLQKTGVPQEGTYYAYVRAYQKDGDFAVSNNVEFAYIPHEHQWDNRYEHNAKYHWHECNTANCYVISNEQKKGYGAHSWSVSIQTKATTDKEGTKRYVCKVCGYSKTEKIPKLTKAQQSIENAPTLKNTVQNISSLKGNGDPAGSSFAVLQAKAKKVGKNEITLSWMKVGGAISYVVYGNRCGTKYKYEKIAIVSGTTYSAKKLKQGTNYKYLVVAVAKDQEKTEKAIAISKSVHCMTAGNKKFGDFTKVTVKKKNVSIGVKKSVTVKAIQVKPKKKKVKQHRKISYESGNPNIATVNKKGKITGKKKGKCTIYAYAQNGVFAKISVTVK
jgi:hypothetical protein